MLTDVQVRRAEVRAKSCKLHDQRGLFVFIIPKGLMSWRCKYWMAGKEKLLVLVEELTRDGNAVTLLFFSSAEPSRILLQAAEPVLRSAAYRAHR